MAGIDFDFPISDPATSHFDTENLIKVIGVGGGGGNAVRTMYEKGIEGVDFYICNTDLQVLKGSPIPNKLQLGMELTNGLGCGAKPEVGREAALESREDVRHILQGNTRMVFITAGMGGGTGTGAAPVIAEIAREMGILTVGIVTTPFKFEGDWRNRIAKSGVAELQRVVDTLLVINNANLMEICPRNIKARDAYKMADKVLCDAAKGIAEIITIEGYMNVDFADVQTVMKGSGSALMGMATHHGDNRAINAVEDALSSPLLDNVDISGATGVLVNITASEDTLTMDEVEVIGEYIHKAVGDNARIILGQVLTDEAGDDLTVTVIATGFDQPHQAPVSRPMPELEIQAGPIASPPPARVPAEKEKKPFILEIEDEDEGVDLPPAHQPQPEAEEPPVDKFKRRRPAPQPPQPERHTPSLFDAMDTGGRTRPATNFYHQPKPDPSPTPRPHSPQPSRPQRLDPTNPKDVEELERVPSYLRRQVDIEPEETVQQNRKISRLTVSDEGEERYRLRDNNSFLFDNVD
ncbi:MAG: cell division protein FtsZ [Bacteroidetes bacterium]|jgi:cell division protein FtsZ|nr:cell division protein FtsZ [Bacteroidota bacterium]